MSAHAWQHSVKIEKVDDDQRLAFGWMYVTHRADGTAVTDHSGETVSIADLERASYEFALESRKAGEMHKRDVKQIGRVAEIVCFTPEKKKALGIPDGAVPNGTWVGIKVDDDETWAGVKSGKFKMFSFGGRAVKETIA